MIRLPELALTSSVIVEAVVADPSFVVDQVEVDCATIPVTRYRFEVVHVLYDRLGTVKEGVTEAVAADAEGRIAVAPRRCAGEDVVATPAAIYETDVGWSTGTSVLVFLERDGDGYVLASGTSWEKAKKRKKVERILRRAEGG